jgi:hypothetical protein
MLLVLNINRIRIMVFKMKLNELLVRVIRVQYFVLAINNTYYFKIKYIVYAILPLFNTSFLNPFFFSEQKSSSY